MANEFETQKTPKAAPNKFAQDIYVMLHDLVYILAAAVSYTHLDVYKRQI